MIFDLTWRQWCGVFFVAGLAALIVGRAAWLLMGRHEQPRDTVLRRAAARIYQALWPPDYEDDEPLTDDDGEPIGDLLECVCGETGSRHCAIHNDVSWPGPTVSAAEGATPVNAPRPGHLHDGEPVIELAGLGAAWDLEQPGLSGHLRDGDLAGLDPEDAETVAQWRDDRDQLAEDSPGPVEEGVISGVSGSALPLRTGGPASAGPGVITATKVGGTWLPLTGQPAPPLRWQPDDTVIDLRDQPRAGPPAWHRPAPDWLDRLLADNLPAWYVPQFTGGAW